jgi:acyl carrier protein
MDFDFFELVKKEFHLENELLSDHTQFRNFAKWSSLNALLFISSLTENTGVFIQSSDLSQWQTLGDIRQYIEKQLNG